MFNKIGKLKPVKNEDFNGGVIYTCPLCGKVVEEKSRRCKACSQKLKWEKRK